MLFLLCVGCLLLFLLCAGLFVVVTIVCRVVCCCSYCV